MGIEPMTSSLPRMRSTTELRRRLRNRVAAKIWSGRRDSNPQHLAWKASALPLRYARPESDNQTGRRRETTTIRIAVPYRLRIYLILVLGEGFEPS